MGQWFEAVCRLLFPRCKCIICGKVSAGQEICPQCRQSLAEGQWQPCYYCAAFVREPVKVCSHCVDHPLVELSRTVAVAPYEGVLKKYIGKLKYYNQRCLAEPMGYAMAWCVREKLPDISFDAVIVVPLTFAREKERGYNQSALLAEALGQKLSIPIWNGVIKRVKETGSQTRLGRQARFDNMKDAFLPDKNISGVAGKTLLLVDDVFTTGATLSACGKILLNAGAKSVYAVTVAAGKNTF